MGWPNENGYGFEYLIISLSILVIPVLNIKPFIKCWKNHVCLLLLHLIFFHFSGTARITVKVDDVNDNAPKILVPDPRNVTTVRISTEDPKGSTILKVWAKDDDKGKSELLHYHLVNPKPFLHLDPNDGRISLTRALKHTDIGKHR